MTLCCRTARSGSAMLETVIVAPVLLLVTTLTVQFALLFRTLHLLDHATVMAARAGTVEHARPEAMRQALAEDLIPLFGSAHDASHWQQALEKAQHELAQFAELAILNPTRASFDDWNDPQLQIRYGARAIPHTDLAARSAGAIGTRSGQNIQDANLLHIRTRLSVPLTVPIAGRLIAHWWPDAAKPSTPSDGSDGTPRVTLTSHALLLMQSDAIENPWMGSGGAGTGMGTSDQGPSSTDPSTATPSDPGTGSGTGSATPSDPSAPPSGPETVDCQAEASACLDYCPIPRQYW